MCLCTVSFETTLEADGTTFDVIFTVGYFSEVMKVFWSTDPDGLWDDNSEVRERERERERESTLGSRHGSCGIRELERVGCRLRAS